MSKITVVINAFNEEKNIERVIDSCLWADEIVVVDDGSTDKTLEILSRLKVKNQNLKVYNHKGVGYVEPARNFAISKANGDWVLIVDADEEIPLSLSQQLKKLPEGQDEISFIEVPRKNIIFGKWMRASMWWPDYNIRFFKKGDVTWSNLIHRPPQTKGTGIKLDPQEEFSIIHYHYESISQFVERLNRYTSVQSKELVDCGYKFVWTDLITKPVGEFLSRFFANRGFEDGLHGLALSLLQAFSFLVMYLKVWEIEKFTQREMNLKEIKTLKDQSGREIDYWFKHGNLSKNSFKRFVQKVGNKLS